MNKDLLSGVVLGALAIAYWFGADAIPKSTLAGQVGADGLPKLLAYVLGALSAMLVINGIMQATRTAGPAPAAEEVPGEAHGWYAHARALGLLAIAIAYIALVPYLGYILSIGLLMAALAIYSGARPTLKLFGIAAAGALIFYGLFVLLLNIPLPPGIWPDLF